MEFSLEKSLEILERTPYVFSSLLHNLSEEWINANEGNETWSAKQVLAHLLVCEETDWMPRIKLILYHPQTIFSPIDMHAHFIIAKNESSNALLSRFHEIHTASLTELKSYNLSTTDFMKQGIHPNCGTVTLQQVISAWVAHDMSHTVQIARIIAKQNTELVGNFKQFLKLLNN